MNSSTSQSATHRNGGLFGGRDARAGAMSDARAGNGQRPRATNSRLARAAILTHKCNQAPPDSQTFGPHDCSRRARGIPPSFAGNYGASQTMTNPGSLLARASEAQEIRIAICSARETAEMMAAPQEDETALPRAEMFARVLSVPPPFPTARRTLDDACRRK